MLLLLLLVKGYTMSQVIKRRSTPDTKAGQYMCQECGQIFETKKEVKSHFRMIHDPHIIKMNEKTYRN